MITQTLQPDDTAIEHLHIRGPADARHRVVRELSHTAPPHVKGDSWVFVRKLAVRGSSTNATGRILQQIAHNLTLAEQGHTDENLIRFNDLSELLAALLSDLASGRAADRWYWQHWSHLFSLAKAEALVSVMTENLDHLNAICAQLASQDALSAVWQALDPNSAARLSNELAWHTGISLVNRHQLSDTAAIETAAGVTIADSLLDRWRPIFADFASNDERRQLASLLLGLEAVPLMLLHAPESTLGLINHWFERPPPKDLQQAGTSSTGPSRTIESAPANHAIQAKTSSSIPTDRAAPSTGLDRSRIDTRHTESSPAVIRARQESGPRTDDHRAATLVWTAVAQPTRLVTGPATAQAADNTEPPLPDQPNQSESNDSTPGHFERLRVTSHQSELDADRFHTAQGGVLYLLNFLNRAEVQALMGDSWQELPNGWGWLYRLAQTLDFDGTDPLNEFFALQLGYESSDQLNALPPLPARHELSELAQRWYGKTEIWQPALLKLPAHIACTPSHLDLYSSLQYVRLEIRLAGLDINPGWLPWLGRVVQFHYTSESP